MRFVQEQRQPVSWKKTLFEGLIPHPRRMELATLPLRLYEKLGIHRLVYALGLTRILPKQIRDMEAMLPRLPQRPLRRILPQVTEARGENKQRVGFFLGCAQSLLFADESAATVRVLSRNGCTVVTPKGMGAWTWYESKQSTTFLCSRNPMWKWWSQIVPPVDRRSRSMARISRTIPNGPSEPRISVKRSGM